MTRRRWGVLLLVSAAACLLAGAFGPGSASADRNGKVQLSVAGRDFSEQPAGPLVDTGGLSPGSAVTGLLGVRSGFKVATALSLRMVDVHDDDNGCTPAEARVDVTCAAGEGDLGSVLLVTVDWAPRQEGPYHRAWQGTTAQLAAATALGVSVPADGERWLRLTATVPAWVGNVIQSDTFDFGLRVVLAGNGVAARSGFDGEQAGNGASGGDQGASSGIDGLAETGVSAALFVVGGVLLVGSGGLLLSAGLRQRRATSEWSSTARRGPRPASPPTGPTGRAPAR